MSSSQTLIVPAPLKKGEGIGVFTPSFPSYAVHKEKFTLGLQVIEDYGFPVTVGFLAKNKRSEGYRPACGQERAKEFMELYRDPSVS